MISSRDKRYAEIVGGILIAVALFAFFYPGPMFAGGFDVVICYPHRDYALPLGALGITMLVVGFIAKETGRCLKPLRNH